MKHYADGALMKYDEKDVVDYRPFRGHEKVNVPLSLFKPFIYSFPYLFPPESSLSYRFTSMPPSLIAVLRDASGIRPFTALSLFSFPDFYFSGYFHLLTSLL